MTDYSKTIDTVVGGIVAVKVIDTSAKLLDTNPKRRRKRTRRSKARRWKI